MPRTLSSTLQTVTATNQAVTRMLFDLTAGAQDLHFGGQALDFDGNTYEPRLSVDGAVTAVRIGAAGTKRLKGSIGYLTVHSKQLLPAEESQMRAHAKLITAGRMMLP